MSKKNENPQFLELKIKDANIAYFQNAKPKMSDYEYDVMIENLKREKPNSPVIEEIGSDLTPGFKKINHSAPMLSLDKSYSPDSLSEWAKKISGDILASPKVDGLAIAIHFNKAGKLEHAETRGDGLKGDEVTENVLEIKGIPRLLKKYRSEIEVRGEVFMPQSVFKSFNSNFANPRNLAAGAIKNKDPKKTRGYKLRFFAYDVLGKDFEKEIEKFCFLENIGFEAVNREVVNNQLNELLNVFSKYLATRETLDFELDGVVYKANQIADQTRLGASRHHPRWAIAYKFQGDSGKSVLREVEWSVSRTRVITPIGIIDPVKLSGAMVSRVSLHNFGLMKSKGVSLGATVLVMRRGGVIPNLEEVLKKGGPTVRAPKKCPSCGFPTEVIDDFLYCTNQKGCRSTRLGELRHFVDTLEIEGFGDKMIEQLYDSGMVTEPQDFFDLTRDDLLSLERVGEILADKLIANVQGRRRIPLAQFLRALGIAELARHTSELLAKNYRTLDKIRSVSEEELSAIHTVGPVIARETVAGLKEKAPIIDQLLKRIQLDEKSVAREGKLSGKSFLFTGAMAAMGRSEAEKKVEAEGGEIASGVTKDLDYLVIGSEGYKNRDKGNKWIKAETLMQKGAAIKIIPEEEFLELLS